MRIKYLLAKVFEDPIIQIIDITVIITHLDRKLHCRV